MRTIVATCAALLLSIVVSLMTCRADESSRYEPLHQAIRAVIVRSYPEATSLVFKNKLHFEDRTCLYVDRAVTKTPDGVEPPLVEVRGPKPGGGVWCEVFVRQGKQPYPRAEGATDRKYFTEYFFHPYSEKLDRHLHVTLRLLKDDDRAEIERLVDQFRGVIESFDEHLTDNTR